MPVHRQDRFALDRRSLDALCFAPIGQHVALKGVDGQPADTITRPGIALTRQLGEQRQREISVGIQREIVCLDIGNVQLFSHGVHRRQAEGGQDRIRPLAARQDGIHQRILAARNGLLQLRQEGNGHVARAHQAFHIVVQAARQRQKIHAHLARRLLKGSECDQPRLMPAALQLAAQQDIRAYITRRANGNHRKQHEESLPLAACQVLFNSA